MRFSIKNFFKELDEMRYFFFLIIPMLFVVILLNYIFLQDEGSFFWSDTKLPLVENIETVSVDYRNGDLSFEVSYEADPKDYEKLIALFRKGKKTEGTKWGFLATMTILTSEGKEIKIVVLNAEPRCAFYIGEDWYRGRNNKDIRAVIMQCYKNTQPKD